MRQPINPYDPPGVRSQHGSENANRVANASVFWFIGSSFLANTVIVIAQPRAGTQPVQWTVEYMATPLLIAAASTVAGSLVYGLVGLFLRRRSPATRLSRIMAALVFCSIM